MRSDAVRRLVMQTKIGAVEDVGPICSRKMVQIVTVPITFRFFFGLLAYVRRRGFAITCVSAPGAELAELPEREGVETWPLKMSRRISPLADCWAIVRLVWFVHCRDVSVLHAHTPKGGMIGVISGALARVPLVCYHLHGFPFVTATGLKRRLLVAIDQMVCLLAHRVFAVGQGVREEAIEHRICPPGRLRVLGNGSFAGVDAARRFNPAHVSAENRTSLKESLGIPPDARVIGFVGRIVRDKGIVELAGAWDLLAAAFPDLHLVIVGEEELEDAVPRSILKSLFDHPRVHAVGLRDDVRSYYAIMDLVALPTYREGLPYVPLEAAAMGIAVVASDVRGCRDAVANGETGRLVAPRRPRELFEACAHYLREPELRARHGRNARERILRDFEPAQIWWSLVAEYEFALRQADGVVI